MAAYTLTNLNILNGLGTSHVAGETVDAGQFVYLDATDSNKAKLAFNATQAQAAVEGIALNKAFVGQPVSIAKTGETTVQAAAFTGAGLLLILGDVAGQMMDAADHGVADYLTVIGWSTNTNKFTLSIAKSGLVK